MTMKNIKPAIIIMALLSAIFIGSTAKAAISFLPWGWIYTQMSSQAGNSDRRLVGPFDSEYDCAQAYYADFGDNDGWLPYNECTYHPGETILAIEDMYSLVGPGDLSSDSEAELVEKIIDLQSLFNIPTYNQTLKCLGESAIKGSDINLDCGRSGDQEGTR